MRFCEGVVPCGTALFAFVREARAHGITPLGKQDSLNSGGVGAGPHSDQFRIVTGFRGINHAGLNSVNIVQLNADAVDEWQFPTAAVGHVGGIAVGIVTLLNPGFQFGEFIRCDVRNGAEIPAHFLPEKGFPAGHSPAPSFLVAARP